MPTNLHNPKPGFLQQPRPVLLRPLHSTRTVHELQVKRRHQVCRTLLRQHDLVDQELGVSPLEHGGDLREHAYAVRVRPVVRYGVEEVGARMQLGLRGEEVVSLLHDFLVQVFDWHRYDFGGILQDQYISGQIGMFVQQARGVEAVCATNVHEHRLPDFDFCAFDDSLGVVHVGPVHLVVSQRGHQTHETTSLALRICCASSEEVCSVGHIAVVVELGEVDGFAVVVLFEKAGEVTSSGDGVVDAELRLAGCF